VEAKDFQMFTKYYSLSKNSYFVKAKNKRCLQRTMAYSGLTVFNWT